MATGVAAAGISQTPVRSSQRFFDRRDFVPIAQPAVANKRKQLILKEILTRNAYGTAKNVM
jgi:hypothetical protein